MRNSILRTVSVMYTLNREMDNVYVTDSYWQKQQQTLVVKRRAGMMDSYLCFNLYTSKCQCAKNNKSKERTLIITDSYSHCRCLWSYLLWSWQWLVLLSIEIHKKLSSCFFAGWGTFPLFLKFRKFGFWL